MPSPFHQGLVRFAHSVSQKLATPVHGEPEEQLRAPFETFVAHAADYFGLAVLTKGETAIRTVGRPDYAVLVADVLTGHVELKKPGTGARTTKFDAHNKRQWKKFQSLPNVLYSDGNEWGLYRSGKVVGKVVRLSGDIVEDGAGVIG